MPAILLLTGLHELKETQKGVEFMCHEMEQICSEGIEKSKRETVLSLTEMGLPVEKITKAVNLSVQEVQKWIDESVSEQ